ncbi:MAG: C25 family cysteine peptidase, partial [bacterium]
MNGRFRLSNLIVLLAVIVNAISHSAGICSVISTYTFSQPDLLDISLQIPEVQFQTREIEGHRIDWLDMGGSIPIFEEEEKLGLPSLIRLISIPWGYQASLEIVDAQFQPIEVLPEEYRDNSNRNFRTVKEEPLAALGEPGVMRWLRLVPLVIHPIRQDPQNLQWEQLVTLDLRIHLTRAAENRTYPLDSNRYWSPIFEEFFSATVLNYTSPISPLQYGGKEVMRGSYLIITDSALARNTTELANWKARKGYDVVVAPIYRPGIAPEEVKNFIRNAYLNWEKPPEVVLLIGDVNMPGIRLPTFYIRHPDPRQNEIDVTDLPYSLMNDDDYFPDLLVGRISVDSPSPTELLTYIVRVIAHERDAHTFPPANFHRATLFAGNFGDGNLPVLSPVETCVWLGSRLRELGWSVDEFYYRRPGDDVNPSPIIASINRGINILAYRGWADANGTHYPQFYRTHIQQLDN